MKILAIEGALGGFTAAYALEERIEALTLPGNRSLEAGLGAIANLVERYGIPERLAVGVGPGGFTGLRITLAYAKALALGWGCPLVGISSFDLLEAGGDFESVLTVVVGRPGVISARYRTPAGSYRASGPIAQALAELPLPRDEFSLAVLGAPEDVLGALAEAGCMLSLFAPLEPHAASALAGLAASARPAASPHALVADYGEAPAARSASRR